MKVQKDLKYMTSGNTCETLVLVKYFKLCVLMTCLTILAFLILPLLPKMNQSIWTLKNIKTKLDLPDLQLLC